MKSDSTSRRRWMPPLAAAAAIVLLAGCAPGGEQSQNSPAPQEQVSFVEGGTVAVGVHADPGNLDPALALTLTSSMIYESMCDKLFNADDTSTVFPQLAADFAEFADDGGSATVTLREDVLFADGTPLDADAVKFSIERFQTLPGSQRAADLRFISEVEVVDDLTVRLHFTGPTPEGVFYEKLAGRAGIQTSPTAVQTLGDAAFAESPVCVGPFKFESRVAQDNVTLVKDDQYFRADEVHLDKLIYRILPDSSVRLTNLKSGDLQVIMRASPIDLATLKSDSSLVVTEYPSQGHDYIAFNMGNVAGAAQPAGEIDSPWAQNPDVRHAFEMAIDREALDKVVYSDAFEPACGFIAPQSPLASDELLACSEYDPEAAEKLLEGAGVDLPVEGTITFSNSPDFRRMAELIQQMANEVGFRIELNPQESTASIESVQGGDFDLYLGTWTGFIDPTISRFVRSDDPSNWSRYDDPEVDSLLDEAETTMDTDERTAIYEQIDEILREDLPMVFLIRPGHISASSADLSGMQFRGTGTAVPAFAGYVDTGE
ncbi:ABC transporter substrate-binding protein [Microbacterium sp. MYb62]|uniref:ABC transporter substrate-binding protein n=1 Tax=Microbacterium sp. MYb62 TaxID=1848690 RepID=UPI000CFBAF03|nr:ABC transporter substrate-binding protein [Microbacterium sp. MYb62]PRB18594.1 hypothetical protein CQ042_04750 [Microbacterium sp. MYb62]